MKRLGVVGAGNVGSALIMELARLRVADEVVVAARDAAKARAAIMDAAGAFPEAAATFAATSQLTGDFDVVVVAAGLPGQGPELLSQNTHIALSAVSSAATPVLVVTGSPVDLVTENLSRDPQLKAVKIIGFGGQLDVARLKFSLIRHNQLADRVLVIGEHGPRAIPVYEDEKDYEVLRKDITTFLKRIAEGGKPRNIATGVQLGRLVQALDGQEQTLCVSMPNEKFGISLTWPYTIKGQSITRQEIGNLEPHASRHLEALVRVRRHQRP